jgi:hypothetical protein
MANIRMLSWSAAMRDLRNERARRAGVREERLRATVGLRGASKLSSWRGRSGRRYVVGIHAATEADLVEVTRAVLIAVRRDREGIARVVDVAAAGEEPRERARWDWMAKARSRGATEMHVHRLAEGEPERRAVMADLKDQDDEPAGGLLPRPPRAAPEPDR